MDSRKNNISNVLKRTFMVIPSSNGKSLLEDLLSTIDISPEQVIVVDQDSKDGTKEFCSHKGVNRLQCGAVESSTYAYNLGIKWALEKKADYICLAKNSTRFLTPVLHQLAKTLLTEKQVGITVPVLRNIETSGNFTHRPFWNLSQLNFDSDNSTKFDPYQEIYEGDFCQFSCALIPASIFMAIGLLDESYNFNYDEIEFCYRLFLKNYRIVYNQAAQIQCVEKFRGIISSFDEAANIEKNKKLFSEKYLVHGVSYPVPGIGVDSWAIINTYLYDYLKVYGLFNQERFRLNLGHPGSRASHLFTVWETTLLPDNWIHSLSSYQHIFVPSRWNMEIFKNAGCKQVSFLPLGFEPSIYHPWGAKFDFCVEKPFLIVCHNQYRKALDVSIKAWLNAKSLMPDAWLFLYGTNIDLNAQLEKTNSWILGKIKWHRYVNDRIIVLEPLNSLSAAEMASLYRGAYAVISNSRSEGFGFTVIEAMACGALTIVPHYGATKEFIDVRNCIPLPGKPIKANYSDKGFGDVGWWWEPSPTDLSACLLTAYTLSDYEKGIMRTNARQFALSNYTWRISMYHLRHILKSIQEPIVNKIATSTQAGVVTIYNNSKIGKFIDITKHQGLPTALKTLLYFAKNRLKNLYHRAILN